MKSKKGFTLIELLAVIVILAVIALIATPIIMNVIKDAKMGAAKDSMYSYVKAVELASTKMLKPDTNLITGPYTTKSGNLVDGVTNILTVDIKGTKPADGAGSIMLYSGRVVMANLEFDGYLVNYDGTTASIPKKTYEIGDVAYLDPTGAVSDCKSGKEWTPTRTATTCYKWNIVKDNGNSVDMLLDHNLGNKVAWLSKNDFISAGGLEADYGARGNNKYGPITTIKQLKNDTNFWTKVETLTNTDNVVRNHAFGGTYTINYNGMKARLITGQEVANIIKNTTWKTNGTTSTSLASESWLYQNTYNHNDNSNFGYWSDTSHSEFSDLIWRVDSNGELNYDIPLKDTVYGIRPIVRVLKSSI